MSGTIPFEHEASQKLQHRQHEQKTRDILFHDTLVQILVTNQLVKRHELNTQGKKKSSKITSATLESIVPLTLISSPNDEEDSLSSNDPGQRQEQKTRDILIKAILAKLHVIDELIMKRHELNAIDKT